MVKDLMNIEVSPYWYWLITCLTIGLIYNYMGFEFGLFAAIFIMLYEMIVYGRQCSHPKRLKK